MLQDTLTEEEFRERSEAVYTVGRRRGGKIGALLMMGAGAGYERGRKTSEPPTIGQLKKVATMAAVLDLPLEGVDELMAISSASEAREGEVAS